jgi:hypothetical protein
MDGYAAIPVPKEGAEVLGRWTRMLGDSRSRGGVSNRGIDLTFACTFSSISPSPPPAASAFVLSAPLGAFAGDSKADPVPPALSLVVGEQPSTRFSGKVISDRYPPTPGKNVF